MVVTTRALLTGWDWRLEILLPLLTLVGLYTLGWWRLRQMPRRSGEPVHLARVWRLVSYYIGVLFIILALMSAVDTLGGQLFTMHMLQHMLLAMFAPPLIWIADPYPVVMWGLPLRWRRAIGGALFGRTSRFRRLIRPLTQPLVAWALYFGFLWGWHDANMYNWALRNELVHDIEHITFFVPAMLLWWHAVGAGPRLHKRFSYPARIAFTLACVPANMLPGVVIALANTVIYTYYATVPFRLWGLSLMDDQRLGGVLMWVPGSMMYVMAVVVHVALWLRAQELQSQPAGRRQTTVRPRIST